jgi:hypothetical protein
MDGGNADCAGAAIGLAVDSFENRSGNNLQLK